MKKKKKKKTVTEKVYIFTHTGCDPYVTDPSTRQARRPMTYKTKIFFYKQKYGHEPQTGALSPVGLSVII
jgi:hypothetical protein